VRFLKEHLLNIETEKTMTQTNFSIEGIPAVLYGEPGDRVYLFLHGKMGYKEEAEAFAQLACPKGWQVLGIDLPGHGERKAEIENFNPWRAVPELTLVMQYMHKRWKQIALRANSIGAWFAMLAYKDETLADCLFVSPIVDMAKLNEDMMGWAGVTKEQLAEKKRIPTNFGETLDWQYYQYAKKNQNLSWTNPTAILYAGKDNLTSRATIDAFAKQHGCALSVMEDGEHWFHTPQQLAVLEQWTREHLESRG
jgi:pimeloyl-ACP methyl ester carboxylesterase